MTTISAKNILTSRNIADPDPDRKLSTLLLRYPRWIHSEFMTHRALSRNASSSRAVPVKKLIDDILADPAVPMFWGKNQKGMQAGEECNTPICIGGDVTTAHSREDAWLHAMDYAVSVAEDFAAAGYHKQIVNRLLEPFSHITVVVSATEWSNFRALRDHPDAEPHIRLLCQRMMEAIDIAPVQLISPGEWHLPFVSDDEFKSLGDAFGLSRPPLSVKLSVARSASTSYKTVEGFDMTLDRAVALHDKLVSSVPIHASPAEHVAQADDYSIQGPLGWWYPGQHRNFVGFRQYRAMIPGDTQ